MLKYLRDKLFDLGPTATTDDLVAAVFTRHATCRATYVGNRASLVQIKAMVDLYTINEIIDGS